jgi:hypothetical protein
MKLTPSESDEPLKPATESDFRVADCVADKGRLWQAFDENWSEVTASNQGIF